MELEAGAGEEGRGGGEGRGVAVRHRHPRLEDGGAGHEVGIETIHVIVERRQEVLLGGRGGHQGEVLQAGLEEVVLLESAIEVASLERRIERCLSVTRTGSV